MPKKKKATKKAPMGGAANSHGGDAAVARAKDAVGSKDAGGSIPGSVAHPTRES